MKKEFSNLKLFGEEYDESTPEPMFSEEDVREMLGYSTLTNGEINCLMDNYMKIKDARANLSRVFDNK
jgi:hypothetical protein